MRTLHVTPYFAPAFRYGGPPHSILGLCRGLRSAGVDVEVLTTTADGASEIPNDVVHHGEYDGVPVRYLRVSFPRRYFNAAGLSHALREALPSVDLVHVHGLWSFPAWIATRECRLAEVPFVVSPRGMLDAGSMTHHRWRKELGYWLRERSYLQRAALLHATSCAEEDKLSQLALGPRIVCLPNGVSVPTRPPSPRFRDRLGVGANDRLVVFLGRLHPIKRLDLALAALDRVRASIPGVRLVLAGPPDGLDPDTLVREAPEPSSVVWVGEVSGDEKWSLLAEADVLVSCSDSESFGMSVVEAMGMGTPVVTTRTSPWREVETERAGFWVAQRADDIADAIEKVLRGGDEAKAMGERGRELVRGRYQWSAIAREMSSHYERVIA